MHNVHKIKEENFIKLNVENRKLQTRLKSLRRKQLRIDAMNKQLLINAAKIRTERASLVDAVDTLTDSHTLFLHEATR